jgi:acetylornithine/N-succinyldiaminopimelate aminotransferase
MKAVNFRYIVQFPAGCNEKAENVYTPGTHGSTFGGNPIACAGALSIMERIDDALLKEVTAKGQYIKDEFTGAKGVKSVAGMGLMWGIEPDKDVKEIVPRLLAKGVVVLTAKEKIRLLPALNIPWTDLKKAVSLMKDVLAESII